MTAVSVPSRALGLALVLSMAALGGEAFTPEHVARLRTVTRARLSPDGRFVAYTLSVPRVPGEDEDGPAWSELHLVSTADGVERPFVTGHVNVGRIAWRPPGREIAFLAKRDGDEHTALYVIPVDGGEARRLVAHETSIREFAFSPDGRKVAFLASEKPPEALEERREKGFDAEVFEEELRPVRLFVLDLEQGDQEPVRFDLEGSASELHWSPRGDRLVCAVAPTPLIDDHYMFRRLRILDAETGEVVGRIENPGKLGAVRISPDGERVAFVSAEDLNDPHEGRLMVASIEGGGFRDLLAGLEGHVTSIAWKDADTLVYLADIGTTTELGTVDLDGERRTLVPEDLAVLQDLSLSADGTRGAVRSDSPRHPSEVYFMAEEQGFGRRITDSNPWLRTMRLARQEVVRYEARDGLEIEGILIHPLDEEPGRRYPLLLTVHGGPESHIRNGWLTRYAYPGQVAAARGFAVFYPNYRGSTGRGVAFSKMGQADYAGGEFDDLLDAVDHLVESGLVDPDRVGITGGSYGGFATAWCCTKHSQRFAAGVMFVGISDQISKSGSTDIPNEMYLVHARKRPWDDWSFFLERSPIRWVEQARTPLLILGGKADTRVHPSQSLELYRQLKVLGKAPVRLVRYPGEGHGNRRAASRYDYNLRMLRWFEHYLQGPGGPPPPPEIDYPLLRRGEEKADDSENEGEV